MKKCVFLFAVAAFALVASQPSPAQDLKSLPDGLSTKQDQKSSLGSDGT
jgi:hypothetical protein